MSAMNSKKTAAIVVTFNRKKMLMTCISRLLDNCGSNCDILLIDNASTDGTYDSVSLLVNDGKIQYFNTGKNIGGAGGFQYGIKKAYELGYEYFWLMDDDTYVNPGALKNLLDADSQIDGNYGFLSSAAYWTDGSLCNMNIQRSNWHKKVSNIGNDIIPIEMATFVSFFVKREVVRDVGLPIKEFFIWSDDLEYSRRISKKYRCYLVPESTVTHAMASNNKVGIESESSDRLWRYRYLYRNEVYVYRREGVAGWMYLYARVLLHTFRVLTKAKGSRREKLQVIWKSFHDGYKFNPSIERVSE